MLAKRGSIAFLDVDSICAYFDKKWPADGHLMSAGAVLVHIRKQSKFDDRIALQSALEGKRVIALSMETIADMRNVMLSFDF